MNWGESEDIPEFAFDPMTMIVAGRVAGKFGVQNVWRAAEDLFKMKLGKQIASPYNYRETVYEGF